MSNAVERPPAIAAFVQHRCREEEVGQQSLFRERVGFYFFVMKTHGTWIFFLVVVLSGWKVIRVRHRVKWNHCHRNRLVMLL